MSAAFSVEGARVAVVGAARSGVAAALLLAKRGARVTLTDMKPSITDRDRLRAAGVEVELGSAEAAAARQAEP